MVVPTCFLTIPALATTVIESGYRVPATLAYAPTNTDYFGATSCGLSSLVTTTWPPTEKARCTLPPSVSGQAYSVTPVVYVPRAAPGHTEPWDYSKLDNYTCDPISPASINKGSFQFACKDLRGKDMGQGFHTISWVLPTAVGISISTYHFNAYPPISTPTYVVNTAKAKTTLVPTTSAVVTTTRTVTAVSTVTVRTTTRTTTCFYTATVTPTPTPPPVSGRGVGRPGSSNPQPDSDSELPISDSESAVMDLKERAVSAAPTIGKPDVTYPPYGVTTIYVKSISTSLYTITTYSTSFRASPVMTTTISVASSVFSTVTVTATPVSKSTS
ncbi:uncharacterized protein B0H64DRAFT_433137 [Chaetomium fimeti]|uniref:Uncharacterized protein n=1 Tax=Chaetomium fimeti TaxID=1854472 RepID=A0AAE0LR65_9PEZI|nr:hypothetical protein B0H64DRAFT_433137 [Chaetomium fimeti]